MTIHIRTRNYRLSAAKVVFVRRDEICVDGTLPAMFEGECSHNVIDNLPPLAPGGYRVSFFDCFVSAEGSASLQRLPGISGDLVLTQDPKDPAVGYLELPPYTFVRISVSDADRGSTKEPIQVGIAMLAMTTESWLNAEGYCDFFIPAGPVTAYACLPGRTLRAATSIAPGKDGDGVVEIRLS